MGQSGDGRAFPALCALAEDSDEAIHCDATLALGELGDIHAVPFLEDGPQRSSCEDLYTLEDEEPIDAA